MAIQINKTPGFDLFSIAEKQLQLPVDLLDFIKISEAKFVIKGESVEVHAPAFHIGQKVTFNPGALTLIEKGVLGANSKSYVRAELIAALQELQMKVSTEKSPEGKTDHMGASVNVLSEAVKKVAEIIEAEENTPKGVTSVDTGTPEEGLEVGSVLSMKPVPLHSATCLYQPVRGTDNSSVYHVVGMGKHIKVAARIKNTQVSIRIEGNIAQAHSEILDSGVDLKGAYASLHVNADTEVLQSKIIRAVLICLSKHLATTMPNIDIIRGKGK